MATILMILALFPALYGALITGDFTQYIYKPTHQQVRLVLTNRFYLIGASLLLWVAGLLWHLLVAPASPWVLVLSAILVGLFITAGFLMPGYILFRSLNQPDWVSASEANENLLPDEPVIGIEVNGDARAYPVDSILRPHMVNDTIGGEAVTMSYCMLCNSAMAFKPELNDQKLQLMTPLQWENNLMLYDPSTKQLFQQLTGRVVGGQNDGQVLDSYPTRIMPWSAWQQLHPDTKVLYHPPQHLFDKGVRTMLRTQIHEPNQRQEEPIFPTISEFDPRLPNKSEVFGVCAEDVCKAYPLTYLQQQPVINDTLDDKALLVAYDPKQDAGDVFYRQLNDQTLTFQNEIDAEGSYLLTDEETGSKWNLTGMATEGTLKGTQLTPYAHFSRVLWFSWVNFYPNTEVAS